MVDVSFVSQLYPLIDPSLWWFWEMIALIFYYFIKFGKQFGKDLHFIMKWSEDHWKWIDTQYVEPGKRFWRRKKGQSFHNGGKPSFQKGGLMGGEVFFHDIAKARPRETKLQPPTDFKLEIQKDPNGKGMDPTSQEYDDFTTAHSMRDILKSNLAGNPGLFMLILVLAIGFLGGFVVGPYATAPPAAHTVTCHLINGTTLCGP